MGREAWAMIAALAVHGALLRAASEAPEGNRLLDGLAAVDPIEIEIDSKPVVVDAPVALREVVRPTEATAAPAKTPIEPASRAPIEARAVAPTSASMREPSSDEESSGLSGDVAIETGAAADARAAPAVGSADEYGEPEGPIGPRPSQPVWALLPGLIDSRAPAAPTDAPRASEVAAGAAGKVISASLRGRDKEVGIDLPATQVVVGAVSSAVRSSGALHNTRATFEVRLGPGGTVTSARLVSASAGNDQAWAAATKAVAASLAGKKLDLGPAAATGATVRVTTTTRHVFPAGTAKAADVKPVCANQIINDIADATSTRPSGKDGEGIPLFTDEHGRPCIPVGVAGISDAANLGAQKQIQVITSATVRVDGQASLPLELPKVNKDPIWIQPTDDAPRPVLPYKLRKRIKDKQKKK